MVTIVSEGVHVESFEGFVDTSLPRLVRFAGWVTGPGGDPQDLVHDALVRVGSRWSTVASRPGDPEAYVRRAIVNGHVSRWRSRRHERLVDTVPYGAAVAGPGDDPRHGQVWQAVRALPRGQRAVVALRFFEDMSVEESARALGVSTGTVKTQTHRALDSLRRTLLGNGAGVDDRSFVAMARTAADQAPVLVSAPGAAERVAEDVAAQRRRRTAAIGAVAAAAAAVVIAIVVWSPWAGVDQVQPVVPAPSVQGSPTVVTEPSVAPVTPEPGAVVTSAPAGSGTASDGAGATGASLDLASYAFAFAATAQPDGELQLVTDVATPWVIDPCRPTTYPTDAQRLGFTAASTYVGDFGQGAALAAYPDAAAAGDVLAGFTRALQACGRLDEPTPAEGSGVTQWTELPSPGLGDESLSLASTEYISDFGLPGTTITAVRVGQYVLVAYTDSMYAGDPDTADRTTFLDEFAAEEVAALQAALAD